ncbi:MAG: hypothetical protein K6E51_11240 [Treponema sp.]|nr:hypothetical protein [Treponema sp.]
MKAKVLTPLLLLLMIFSFSLVTPMVGYCSPNKDKKSSEESSYDNEANFMVDNVGDSDFKKHDLSDSAMSFFSGITKFVQIAFIVAIIFRAIAKDDRRKGMYNKIILTIIGVWVISLLGSGYLGSTIETITSWF